MRRWIVPGVLVMVTSGSAGTLALSDSARWLWSYTFAAACPTDEPAPDCVSESAETVEDAWLDDTGMEEPPETALAMDAQGWDTIYLAPADADRIGVTGSGEAVTVTKYDRRVLSVTGPNGEVAVSPYAFPTSSALLVFLAITVQAMIAVALFAHWRRLKGAWPAVACTAVGVVVGLLLMNLPVGAGFAMPGLFAGTVVGALAAAAVWVRFGLRSPVQDLRTDSPPPTNADATPRE